MSCKPLVLRLTAHSLIRYTCWHWNFDTIWLSRIGPSNYALQVCYHDETLFPVFSTLGKYLHNMYYWPILVIFMHNVPKSFPKLLNLTCPFSEYVILYQRSKEISPTSNNFSWVGNDTRVIRPLCFGQRLQGLANSPHPFPLKSVQAVVKPFRTASNCSDRWCPFW